MSRGLTENEATEPHRPGLPRGLHQGTADGVRHRVQPAREARDGGVARMTVASPRPRPAAPGTDRLHPPGRARRRRRDRTTRRPARTGCWPIALAGFDAFEALPAETNRLYTTYIDLRGAQLARRRLHRGRRRTEPTSRPTLPDGSDGLLDPDRGRRHGRRACRAEAAGAGVELTTVGELLRRTPRSRRALLDGGARSPPTTGSPS